MARVGTAMYVSGGLMPIFILYKNLKLFDTLQVYIVSNMFRLFNIAIIRPKAVHKGISIIARYEGEFLKPTNAKLINRAVRIAMHGAVLMKKGQNNTIRNIK